MCNYNKKQRKTFLWVGEVKKKLRKIVAVNLVFLVLESNMLLSSPPHPARI